jgi:hypothetical protein
MNCDTTIDDLIDRRNDIQLASGDSDKCWQMLGVANRHIDRLVSGVIPLTDGRLVSGVIPLTDEIVREIEACFERTIRECPVKLSSVSYSTIPGKLT